MDQVGPGKNSCWHSLPSFSVVVAQSPCMVGLFCTPCDLDFYFPLTVPISVLFPAEHTKAGAAPASGFCLCVEGRMLGLTVGFHTICPPSGLLPKPNKCHVKSSVFPAGA